MGAENLFVSKPSKTSARECDFTQASLKKQVCWKILIVDADKNEHSLTKLALAGFLYDGRAVEISSAFSSVEAKTYLEDNPDTAIVLMDVDLEEDKSGFEVVRFARHELHNRLARIILRVSKSYDLARQIMLEYDINDFRSKSELNAHKLHMLIVAALRSYSDMRLVAENNVSLTKIVSATAAIYKMQSAPELLRGVLTKIGEIMNLPHENFSAFCCVSDRILLEPSNTVLTISTGIGDFVGCEDKAVCDVLPPYAITDIYDCAKDQDHYILPDALILFCKTHSAKAIVIYVKKSAETAPIARSLLNILSANIAIAYDNIALNNELEQTRREVIERIGVMAEYRSQETGNHIKRVARYSYMLAIAAGMVEPEAKLLQEASTMHDIGKVGIADSILNKPGSLTPEEYEEIKEHANLGGEILRNSSSRLMQISEIIAREHHERWDGCGYPRGLKGEEIHPYGRIVAIADVFDALTTDRVYKKAWSADEALNFIRDQAGKHFDPHFAQLFVENRDRVLEILRECKD
ncbi:MAG: DUF3369 domain-containing protein [Helicobacteraceae bacterium]|jgi:response regulator RpfG family c-di-GMP phosphodiesterase|nr:DUF3369 domain-containing protein [Helicobacteraceae bacterium]